LSDLSDMDFAIHLTKNYGVVPIPVSAFYKDGVDNKVVRFCFAKKEETLEKAVSKLKAFS
jgi:methionine aminotransferase